MVTMTEYMLSVFGPFFADGKKQWCSNYQKHEKINANGIKDWLKESDIFILDRGFRDVLELLEDGGFTLVPHIPSKIF